MALLVVMPIGHAACEALAKRLNTELRYPASESGIMYSDCKTWPADPSKMLMAIARLRMESAVVVGSDVQQGDYDLDVFVLRTDSGGIISHLLQPDALASDSIKLDDIAIDTAAYRLAPNARAFGVRTHYSHRHGEWEGLSLYVPVGTTLNPVLNQLEMVVDVGDFSGKCYLGISKTRRTLAIAATSHQGYADLLLVTKTAETEGSEVGDECEYTKPATFLFRGKLRFDGTKYPAVPIAVWLHHK